MVDDLPDWLADPALTGLWDRVRERLERNGLVATGRVHVSLHTRSERHAASALLGRAVTRDRVTVDLAELDARLRERSGHAGLVEVVRIRYGDLRDRPAEREARAERRAAPMELARRLVDHPWTDAWVADLRRTGLLTRAADAEAVVRHAASVLQELLTGTATRSRVELAAQVVGDAHALDEDRVLHRVVLRALAAARGAPPPETLAERRALWESFGVSPDTLSSTCLTLGLVGDQPRHLTRWDLLRMAGLATPVRPVVVCENPRVLEAVAETYADSVPVVCTSGEPNTVVTAVLEALVECGATLRYHGDFDWPGIAIANRVTARFGAEPWLMSAADYERSVRPDAPELTGSPVEAFWDPELGPAMRAHGRVLHEETVLAHLLDSMRTIRPRPDGFN